MLLVKISPDAEIVEAPRVISPVMDPAVAEIVEVLIVDNPVMDPAVIDNVPVCEPANDPDKLAPDPFILFTPISVEILSGS